MTRLRIVVNKDEVLKAIEGWGHPVGETSILLGILGDRGLRMNEEPGETPSHAIRKHFHVAEFRRVLYGLKESGRVEVLTGAEWAERGRHFYDQRPNARYWAIRESE